MAWAETVHWQGACDANIPRSFEIDIKPVAVLSAVALVALPPVEPVTRRQLSRLWFSIGCLDSADLAWCQTAVQSQALGKRCPSPGRR